MQFYCSTLHINIYLLFYITKTPIRIKIMHLYLAIVTDSQKTIDLLHLVASAIPVSYSEKTLLKYSRRC
uniref:Uncharacterized protein n=1 Tax=Pararge aegeria TaxID=116150 RepID=S4P7F5_9NEOP